MDLNSELVVMTYDDDLKWHSQISGKGGLLSSLNQRRLRNSLNYDGLRKVTEGLFTSKLRYELKLLGPIRWQKEDVASTVMSQIQIAQNKLLRFLNKTKISDEIKIETMLSVSGGRAV